MTTTEDAPTVDMAAATMAAGVQVLNTGCAHCGGRDGDTELVGWSLCAACFHGDRFNGLAYWTPLWCGLLFAGGFAFLVAALLVLVNA